MTEIWINAWNEKGYSVNTTHRFKLDGDVFYEMLIAKTGFALDNIDDEIYKEKIIDDADDIVEETIAPKIVKSEKELNIREPVKVSNYYEMF